METPFHLLLLHLTGREAKLIKEVSRVKKERKAARQEKATRDVDEEKAARKEKERTEALASR